MIKVIPATPAVTKTIVVTPAEPEKYVLTLTRKQMQNLIRLDGDKADDGGVLPYDVWFEFNQKLQAM